MYSEDENSDWDEEDSEEERKEAEEALYNQIYHTYQGINEHLKDGLLLIENATCSLQNGGGISSKEKVSTTSFDCINQCLDIKISGKDTDLICYSLKDQEKDKVKGSRVSSSEIMCLDSESGKNSLDSSSVRQPIRTCGEGEKIATCRLSKTEPPSKQRNRDTFRELTRGCSLGNSQKGTSDDREMQGFQGSEDDDSEDFLEIDDSQKGGSVIICESEDERKGSHVSDSEIVYIDSESSEHSQDTLTVIPPIRTYSKVTIARPLRTLLPSRLGKGTKSQDSSSVVETVDCEKRGDVIRYESSNRILGSDFQNNTERKLTKENLPAAFGNSQNEWSPYISKRYFSQDELRDGHLKCYNCFMLGHVAKDCPEPKALPTCPLCGVKGHTSYECPHQLCFNCDRPGHQSKLCPFPYQSPYYQCLRCTMYGHLEQTCPDIWRQYHLTTEDGKLIKAKKPFLKRGKMFCYNCGLRGHLGHMCEKPRMSVRKGEMITLPSMPLVCQYKTQIRKKSFWYLRKLVAAPAKEEDLERKDNKECHSKFTEEHMNTEGKEFHNKKQKKKKQRKKKHNGTMGDDIILPENDADTEKKALDDRKTHPLSTSVERNGMQIKPRKSKRKRKNKNKFNQEEFLRNLQVGPFTMTLRPKEHRNKRCKVDHAAEHVQDSLPSNTQDGNLPSTSQPVPDSVPLKKKKRRKKKSRQHAVELARREIKKLMRSSIQGKQ